MLLGAFDPPTNAHVAIARAASEALGVPAAFCVTKVVLDRPDDRLLSSDDRLRVLDALADEEGLGLAEADRGTYLEVGRALRAQTPGMDVTFVVGSDKLSQLADPRFYPDGRAGVDATFREVRFVVVPRGRDPAMRPGLHVLPVDAVFDDPADAAISASEVRRRIRAGRPVAGLVPPVVARGLERYTAAEQ